ncbi:MAG: hypothetical protein GEV06_17695 [Luteitalea sp.]|nr:hypothetical protein [Luteitalea sp.]
MELFCGLRMCNLHGLVPARARHNVCARSHLTLWSLRRVALRLGFFLMFAAAVGATRASAQEHVRLVVLISANAEWAPTKAVLAPQKVERSPYGEFFTHVVAGEPVLFMHGGWGKIDAAASAEYAISRWQPKVVINLGTCGGIEGRIQRGDRLLVTRTVVYDIHEAMGDASEAVDAYSTDIDLKWLGHDRFPVRVRRTMLLSGDRDLVPAALPDLLRRFPDASAADWESGAIARVADRRQTRLLILRAVSDLVGPTRGEAMHNLPAFQDSATRIMRLLLDDLRSFVPYILTRLATSGH